MPPSAAMCAGPVNGEVGSEATGRVVLSSTCRSPSADCAADVLCSGEVPGSCEIRSWLGFKDA